jgi:TolB-like protein/class 3 adenylate cyclase/Flp pilus assembly protein TadD
MEEGQKTKERLEIAYVLFIDIVGYSKLTTEEESEALPELYRIVRNTQAAREAETARQLIFLPTGDGMALVFTGSIEEPVECALQLSQTLRAQSTVPVRMGIHSGPVHHVADVNQRENVAGAGINMAQRVMDCGDAGHILVSKRVAEDLGHYRRWQPYLHDLGDFEVKHGAVVSVVNLYGDGAGNPAPPAKLKQSTRVAGLSQRRVKRSPILVGLLAALLFTVAALALVFAPAILKPLGKRNPAYREQSPAAADSLPIPEKSVAVLPFENLSQDQENAYFVDGMQDEVITRLAKIGELRVISRTSTQRYKTRPSNVGEIARELGVAHLVEGTVQRVGDRVRINVQLIRVANEGHLWAEIYDRNLTDIFAVQTELATRIAQSLQATLSGAERKAVAEKPTTNLAAYDAYLRGIDFFSRPGQTEENQRKAAESFAEAVRLDSEFAQAWASLSQANGSLFFLQFDTSAARKEAAHLAAETATRLSPSSPETLLANAYYRYHVERDYDGARLLFEKIQREMPSNSDALTALARIARRQSRWKQSIHLYEQAAELNPRDAYLFMDRAWTFSMLRQFAASADMITRALAIKPDDAEVLVSKVKLLQTTGDLPGARTVLARIPSGAASGQADGLRVTQALWERNYNEAVRLLETRLTKQESESPGEVMFSQVLLGDARSLAGDREGAKQAYLAAKAGLEAQREDQPQSPFVASNLAFTEAGLGNKEGALREAERAVALLPAAKDPVFGPGMEEALAGVEAQVGESERAIARLERLLITPYGAFPLTQATLRLDPTWDPLRAHPRFKELVESPVAKTMYE